jgi:hypothetical protein
MVQKKFGDEKGKKVRGHGDVKRSHRKAATVRRPILAVGAPMTSEALRDPTNDQLLTPQNCMVAIIDEYEPLMLSRGSL